MDSQFGATVVGVPEMEQHPRLARWLGKVIDVCLYIAVAAIPLIVFPFTLDTIELPKQTVLLVLASVALLAWVGQAMCLRRFVLARSWLHLVVVAFFVGYTAVAIFSEDRYLSFAGNFGQMQWSVSTLAALIVLYALLANTVKNTTKLYHLILAFLGSSFVVGLLGVFQLTGVYVLGWVGPVAEAKTYSTIGTLNSLGVFMTVPLILAASLTVLGCKDRVCILGRGGKPSSIAMGVVWATLGVSVLVALIVDYWVVWATILFGTALLVVIPLLRSRRIDRPTKLIVPSVLVGVSLIFLMFRTPINLNLPSEVSPSASSSWAIARLALQEKPLVGSGPGTWIYDYAKHRSAAVNLSPFWTVRFERGLTTFFTLFATIGLVGMALWIMVIVSAIVKSATHLVLERDDDAWQAYLTVFTGWATVTFTAFVYNYNLSHHVLFWMLLALLASMVTREALVWDVKRSVVHSSLLSITFIFVCVLGVSTMWLSVQRLVADAKYASAVEIYRAGQPVVRSGEYLTEAVSLNRWNDAYYRNLSQAYLIQASQELQGTPDQDRATRVNNLVAAAVNAAKQATDVTPSNVDNWFNFARVLRSISSFTRGADEKAIEMYREALKREPANPVFLNEIGELHILRSDAFGKLLESNDAQVRQDAEKNVKAELDKAAEALNQSIQVKPDFAEAHYNLGLVYERQGRVQDSIARLEQVLRADPKNIGVGFQLAILYYRNNEKDRSLDLFEQIVAFDPSYSNARWYLASIYEERGRYDDAIIQVEKVKELNPDNQVVSERLTALMKARAEAKRPGRGTLPEPVEEVISGSPEQNEVQSP